jgi:hypothetical protein
MSATLPLSLSPHVVVLASPDLVELLKDSKLPPLPELLRSFTPLESSWYTIIVLHRPVLMGSH